MAAKFQPWSEGRDPEEVGIFVGKFKVSLAELQDIDSRSLADEMGMTQDILDKYELTGRPWTSVADWVWEQVRHHDSGKASPRT